MKALTNNPYAVLLLVAVIWAGNAIAGKLAAGHVSPMLLTLLRWVVAVAVIVPFAWPDLRRDRALIRRHWRLMFALGAFGFTGFNALFYWSLNHTSAINVTITQSAMPLLVFLGNLLFFRVPFNPLQLVGFSLTLVGVAITVSGGDWQVLRHLHLNKGDALILAAVVLYGGYTLALRFKPDFHWRSAIALLSVSAMISAVPLALLEWQQGNAQVPDAMGLGVLAYIALFPSLVAQSFYIRGVELIGANRANLFINLVPVFGAVLAVMVLGEVLHLYHIAALAFVLGGILLAEWSAKRR